MHFIETCLLNDFGPAFFVGTSGMAKDDLDLSTDVVNATTDLVRIVFAGCNTWGIKKTFCHQVAGCGWTLGLSGTLATTSPKATEQS